MEKNFKMKTSITLPYDVETLYIRDKLDITISDADLDTKVTEFNLLHGDKISFISSKISEGWVATSCSSVESEIPIVSEVCVTERDALRSAKIAYFNFNVYLPGKYSPGMIPYPSSIDEKDYLKALMGTFEDHQHLVLQIGDSDFNKLAVIIHPSGYTRAASGINFTEAINLVAYQMLICLFELQNGSSGEIPIYICAEDEDKNGTIEFFGLSNVVTSVGFGNVSVEKCGVMKGDFSYTVVGETDGPVMYKVMGDNVVLGDEVQPILPKVKTNHAVSNLKHQVDACKYILGMNTASAYVKLLSMNFTEWHNDMCKKWISVNFGCDRCARLTFPFLDKFGLYNIVLKGQIVSIYFYDDQVYIANNGCFSDAYYLQGFFKLYFAVCNNLTLDAMLGTNMIFLEGGSPTFSAFSLLEMDPWDPHYPACMLGNVDMNPYFDGIQLRAKLGPGFAHLLKRQVRKMMYTMRIKGAIGKQLLLDLDMLYVTPQAIITIVNDKLCYNNIYLEGKRKPDYVLASEILYCLHHLRGIIDGRLATLVDPYYQSMIDGPFVFADTIRTYIMASATSVKRMLHWNVRASHHALVTWRERFNDRIRKVK